MVDLCKICNTRRPRRHCPAVEGAICSLCCGTEREVSLSCPYDCEYLRESRLRDKPASGPMPHPEVQISENFMDRNQILLLICTQIWWRVAQERDGVLDSDLRDAVGSVVRTRKTAASSGLILGDRPENAIAAAMVTSFEQKFAEWRAEIEQRAVAEGMNPAEMVRDGDVLKMLIFLERLAVTVNNGRPRCRAFFDSLRSWNDRVTTPPSGASNS